MLLLRTFRPRIVVAPLVAIIAVLTIGACAQVAPAPQPNVPPTAANARAGYPQGQPYPQSDMAQLVPAAAPRTTPLRELFAGTISALLHGVSGSLVTGVTQGVAGGIVNWFDRKALKTAYGTQPNAGNQSHPTTTYGAQPPYPTTSYPTDNTYQTNPYTTDPYATNSPTHTANPTASNPYAAASATNPDPYTQPQSYDWSTTQVYDPRTGQASSAQGGGYAVAAPNHATTLIVAGGAYDVSAIGPGGVETYVNAATHEFHTGDRFKVYFRPTLPGRLDVYNINPYGNSKRIDSSDVAAGQLTTLGPYEFTATKGDEALRFLLSPCSTPQLLATTRDIVNVGAYGGSSYGSTAPASGGFNLANCGAPTTRSLGKVKTRDIVKVGVDGTTSFALDPVSQAELTSGQLTPREFTIYFDHR